MTSIAKSLSLCMRTCHFAAKTPYLRKEYNSSLFANLSGVASSQQPKSLAGHNSKRSLWYLAPYSSRSFNGKTSWPTLTCSCGGLHTEGDRVFVDVLKNEIEQEKENMLEMPPMSGGWKVNIKGAECSMEKLVQGDKIRVTFNVNQSVPPHEGMEGEEDQEIVSKPDFTVEVNKPSTKNTLTFDCFFPDAEDMEVEEEPENNFSIRSVLVHEGEIDEKVYSIETENIDTQVYEHLLKFLAEREISNEFGDELIEFATSLENQEYIKSLEKLHSFINCK